MKLDLVGVVFFCWALSTFFISKNEEVDTAEKSPENVEIQLNAEEPIEKAPVVNLETTLNEVKKRLETMKAEHDSQQEEDINALMPYETY